MRPVQREFRQPVVERFFIKSDNDHVTTFMIGMAICAVELLRFGKPSVHTGSLRKVVADVDMANDA